MTNTKRLVTFDFLRGFFVFLALLEHYSYFMNHLFVKYYDPSWFGAFQYSFQYTNQSIPMDGILFWLMKFFGAWVSQIYMALATFNLALTSGEISKTKMIKNNLIYLFLFCIFSIENFVIGTNFGESFSPNPLQCWMIALFFFNTTSFYLGKKLTIIAGATIGILGLIPGINSNYLAWETYIQATVHSDMNLECRPDIFFGAATIGYFFGILYREKSLLKNKMLLLLSSVSFLVMNIFMFLAPIYPVRRTDILQHEYDWSYNPLGTLCIWFTITTVLGLACWLERVEKGINLKPINQIGIYSLWYFVFHKVFFLEIFIPLRVLFANIFRVPIENTFYNNFSAIVVYSILFFGIAKFLNLRNK